MLQTAAARLSDSGPAPDGDGGGYRATIAQPMAVDGASWEDHWHVPRVLRIAATLLDHRLAHSQRQAIAMGVASETSTTSLPTERLSPARWDHWAAACAARVPMRAVAAATARKAPNPAKHAAAARATQRAVKSGAPPSTIAGLRHAEGEAGAEPACLVESMRLVMAARAVSGWSRDAMETEAVSRQRESDYEGARQLRALRARLFPALRESVGGGPS